jgi:hypothetical protein
LKKQGQFEAERISKTFGERHCFAADREALFGIPKQPIRQPAQVPRARAGVVPAIEQAVGAVPLGIIEPSPSVRVLASGRGLAGEQTGRPSAVERLQTQSLVRIVRGQVQQPVRQSAALADPAVPFADCQSP